MLYDNMTLLALASSLTLLPAAPPQSETPTTPPPRAGVGQHALATKRKRKITTPYKCSVCGKPNVGHFCTRHHTFSMPQQRHSAERTPDRSTTGSRINYRVVKLSMRNYLPPPPAHSNAAECFCAQSDCPACFPLSFGRSDAPPAKRPNLGQAPRALVGHAPEPPSELAALATIRDACADVERILASLVLHQGDSTGATEPDTDTASSGEASDESSDDEEFDLPINGGRGRFHRIAP